jgi:hypothetical protein
MTMRWVAAAGVLVSGVVHLVLWFDGFRDIAWIGPLFLLNAAAGVVIAGLLLLWRSWPPPALAVGFGASTLGAFLLSATVGLLGVHEIFLGTWQITAGVAEVVAVVAGLAVLLRERPAVRSPREPQNRFAVRRTDLD